MIRFLNKIKRASFFTNSVDNIGGLETKVFPRYEENRFDKIAYSRIRLIEKAFHALKEADDSVASVTFTDYNNTLKVYVIDQGEFKLFSDNSQSFVYLFTPLSGSFSYYYNEEEGKFYNTRDEHIMEEMLTRNVLKICKGYLDI